ncbi:hypothetical protein [Sporolactobacillus terrae]|uniref:hypothetical protein n=1 Tax=Sporolactobacillus terrae TaxID=269673 RepID=UPI001119530A|nr:hypothetical protein [Sporolactobacillus terrae]
MKKKQWERLMIAIVLLCTIIGGFIGLTIADVTIDFSLAATIICAPLLGLLPRFFLAARHKKKMGNIPEADERTALILKRYFLGVLYVVLFGSGAALLVLYAMGVESIETGLLIVSMMVLYVSIAIGTLIAAKL